MFGENRWFFTNEPIGLDKIPDMKECSRMGIRSIKGGNRILMGIHFEFPDNAWFQCVSPRILTIPLRVSADTGRPPRVYAGFRPCMGRVMREIRVPSPRHFSTHFSLSPSSPSPSLWPSPTIPTSSDPTAL